MKCISLLSIFPVLVDCSVPGCLLHDASLLFFCGVIDIHETLVLLDVLFVLSFVDHAIAKHLLTVKMPHGFLVEVDDFMLSRASNLF